jgi:diguanylate cyclase (GGDEF)-like protein/PAS domain S-box-containing protein
LKEVKPILLDDLMGSLESKIDNVSSLLNQYKHLHTSNANSLTDFLNIKDISLFDGRFRSILEKIDCTLDPGTECEKEFDSIINKCSDTLIEVTREGQIIFADSNTEKLIGFNREELTGHSIYTFLKNEYKPVLEHFFSTEIEENLILLQCTHKSGKLISLEGHLEVYVKNGTTVFGIALRDITSKGDLQSRLQRVENNYDALSETVNEVILRIDEKFNIIYSNSAVKSIFGYNTEEVISENLSLLFPPEILKRYEKNMQKYFYIDSEHRVEMGINNSLEILGLHKNRGISPMEISFGNTKDYEERTITCIIRDISQRKNAERKLRKLAYFDKLTNLGNRDLFHKDMVEHFQKQKIDYQPGSLMFLDLDGFKNINDTLGHDAGDLLLQETAKRLHDCLRESDSVYRLGGDEFLVLLRKIREKKDASKVAKNILNTLRMPYYLKLENQSSATVNVGVSVGVVIITESDNNINEMTKKADLAMYASKNAGKNRYTFYTEEMIQIINERWELEQGLKTALANKELELNYQPIVSSDGKIKGLEALLRWYHPVMGYISPDKFIPIAEETNMIIPIGAWVLEKSCLDLSEWNSSGYPDLYVSVNLSTIQFDQPDVVKSITNVIKRTNCNPANLKLELTETGIMQAPDQTIEKMNLLKEVLPDIQIMVDDFGTGYSSLNYLANLPADILKIDLSFVSRLHDSNNRKVVNSIINLAEALEMGYVAEGIETIEEWDYFRERNCNNMQGFYFSRAVKKEKVLMILKAGKLPLNNK